VFKHHFAYFIMTGTKWQLFLIVPSIN